MLYFIVCILSDRPEETVYTQMWRRKLFATHTAILATTVGSKLDLFKF